jgi:hypothetical protein
LRAAAPTFTRRSDRSLPHFPAKLRREWLSLVRAELRKYGYNPDEPRVPKYSPGAGRWTDSGNNGVVFTQNEVTPHSFTIEQLSGRDPLDPQRLNKPISADEQQKVADALTLITNGNVSALNPHAYGNLPHRVTGAVLPASTAGYTAYDVPGLGGGRGEGRLLVDNATGAIYYTKTIISAFTPFSCIELGTDGHANHRA